MNRVYNNEGIIMACIVRILRERDMDIALLYLVSTILIDRQSKYRVAWLHGFQAAFQSH